MKDREWNETLRKELDSIYPKTTAPSGFSKTVNPPQTPMQGWICPVCGRGLSPYTSVCPCNRGKGWEITC